MRKFNQRLLENLHIPLWFLKDIAWSHGYKELGTMMIIPTITLAFYITWLSRNDRFHFLPNLSVVLWISANSLWMLDEFFEVGLMIWSRYTFIAGIATILYWIVFIMPLYIKNKKKSRKKLEEPYYVMTQKV